MPITAPDTLRWGHEPLTFELRSSHTPALARAALVLRPWLADENAGAPAMSWTLTSDSDSDWLIRADDGEAAQVKGSVNRAVTALEYHAIRRVVEDSRLLTFHAALVARDRRGVLILGPNEAGKSTLACDLWRSGYALLGDDVTIVDAATADARSAPRRVSLRGPSRQLLGDELWGRIRETPACELTLDGLIFHPDEIDGQPRTAIVRLAACVFLARRGASAETAARLSPGAAAFALLPYANLARRVEMEEAIQRIAPLAGQVPAYDLPRAPLATMVGWIDDLLRGKDSAT